MHAQSKHRTSSWPAILVAAACVSGMAYFVFFRTRSAPAEPAPAPAAAEVAAQKVDAKPVEEIAPPAPDPAKPDPSRVEGPVEKKVQEPRRAPAASKVEAPPPAPVKFETSPPARSALHEIDELCAQGRWREARAKLAPLFVSPCPDHERLDLAKKGLEICQQLLVVKPDEKDIELYEIQQGDTLEGIARKFKTLSGVKGSILLVNNYRENAILRAGRKVKVPKGTWSLGVDKSLFRLYVCYEGAPFKEYRIAIGADQKTPAAKFVVGAKNPKPNWFPPAEINYKGKIPVPYGDPANPLGEWWIALDHDLHHGLGIHGTNDPGSIGSKASNGCIRMLNDEVGEVAALAYKGMAVTIVE